MTGGRGRHRTAWIVSIAAVLFVVLAAAAVIVPAVLVSGRAFVTPGDPASLAPEDRTPVAVGGEQTIAVGPGWRISPAVSAWPTETWPALLEPETPQELRSPDDRLSVRVAGHIDGVGDPLPETPAGAIVEPLASGAVAWHTTEGATLTAAVRTATGWVELRAVSDAEGGLDPYRPTLALLLDGVATD